ncbi:MAG: histidine kinase dimerization/phospho-acceptor domain-containing protein [Dehalococcoidia bacterium]|nr:histidine kinase dimerization/phospho-acceptor domain-containing protein [Dehalococcoidia bacterium]
MAIRWRLTLWFCLILLIIMVLSGGVLYTLLGNYLADEVDNNLRLYSARVHGTLIPGELQTPLDYSVIHDKLPPVNEFAFPSIYIQLVDRQGKTVVKSDNLGAQELPVSPSLLEKGFSGRVAIETVSAGEGARVRIMVSPMFLHDQTLLLEVGQSLRYHDSIMAQAKWALLAGVLLALVLTAVLGLLLVRRALLPVEYMTQTAKSIEESSDLNRRLGYTGPPDEIGRLATTFDHMLEHLDRVFQSQKHFVADASHELRTPLTVIQGNLDLLKRNLSEKDRRESLRAMEAESRRMAKIVSDLLVLAELESGHPEPLVVAL